MSVFKFLSPFEIREYTRLASFVPCVDLQPRPIKKLIRIVSIFGIGLPPRGLTVPCSGEPVSFADAAVRHWGNNDHLTDGSALSEEIEGKCDELWLPTQGCYQGVGGDCQGEEASFGDAVIVCDGCDSSGVEHMENPFWVVTIVTPLLVRMSRIRFCGGICDGCDMGFVVVIG